MKVKEIQEKLDWNDFLVLSQNDSKKLYQFLKSVTVECQRTGLKFKGTNEQRFLFFLYKDFLIKKLKEAGYSGVVTWQN